MLRSKKSKDRTSLSLVLGWCMAYSCFESSMLPNSKTTKTRSWQPSKYALQVVLRQDIAKEKRGLPWWMILMESSRWFKMAFQGRSPPEKKCETFTVTGLYRDWGRVPSAWFATVFWVAAVFSCWTHSCARLLWCLTTIYALVARSNSRAVWPRVV